MRSTEVMSDEPSVAEPLLRLLHDLGYISFLVLESTGLHAGARNLINLPRARLSTYAVSPTLNLAARGLLLVRVNEKTVGMHHRRRRGQFWSNASLGGLRSHGHDPFSGYPGARPGPLGMTRTFSFTDTFGIWHMMQDVL